MSLNYALIVTSGISIEISPPLFSIGAYMWHLFWTPWIDAELSPLSLSGGPLWMAVKICDSCMLNPVSEQFWLHSSWFLLLLFFPLVEEKLVVKPWLSDLCQVANDGEPGVSLSFFVPVFLEDSIWETGMDVLRSQDNGLIKHLPPSTMKLKIHLCHIQHSWLIVLFDY